MTNSERLSIELEATEAMITFLTEQLDKYRGHAEQLTYELNRARRLEKELQDGKPKS